VASTVQPIEPSLRRRPTTTSAFGVGRREAHDASAFYARFTPPVVSDDEKVLPHAARDEIWVGDAREMDRYGNVADNSVALVVTSPPYFAGKEYEAALGVGHVPADYAAYLSMLHDVFAQCLAKLEPGGRIAVNVANLGRKPYRSLSSDVIEMLERLGFLLRGEIIWQKSRAAGGSCAWGTYQRPANPVLRDVSERIVIACKGRFDRALTPEERRDRDLPHEATITMDEFVDATTDLWDIGAESATRVGHPAPFPVELPRRLIDLYTYRGDLVLDPFMGSGSTAVAALRTERHYIGFETDEEYATRARRRIDEERARPVDPEAGPSRRVTVLSSGRTRGNGPRPAPDAVREGRKARELARQTLGECGFTDVEEQVPFRDLGVTVDFRARDESGRAWLFDLAGAFSATRPGLKRAEVLWSALGRASVLHEAVRRDPGRDDLGPLVLFSVDLPAPRSAVGKALAAACPADGSGPIRDVVELLDPESLGRLALLAVGGAEGGRPPA
jgi:site-specific DNA-methyltransferase (adenine-specific)